MTSADEYERFARAHLPPSVADRWVGLLRPVIDERVLVESEHWQVLLQMPDDMDI